MGVVFLQNITKPRHCGTIRSRETASVKPLPEIKKVTCYFTENKKITCNSTRHKKSTNSRTKIKIKEARKLVSDASTILTPVNEDL
jgi:hypothetical protein